MGDRGHRGHGGNRGGGQQRAGAAVSGGQNGMSQVEERMAAVSLDRQQQQQHYDTEQADLPETLISNDNLLRITPRPADGGGKKGTKIELEANHFRFNLQGQVVVQQYDVTLTRYDSGGKARKVNPEESHMLFWHLVESNPAIFGPPEQNVYDRRKQLFCSKELEECKNKRKLTLRCKSILRKDKDKDTDVTCEIKHASAIHVNDVKQVYNDNLTERERQHIQFLELLFRQGRYFNDHLVPAGRSFYLRSHDGNRLDLGCGRELLRGFYLASRLIDNWQLSLNVDWNATAFYEPDNLTIFAAKFLMAQYNEPYSAENELPQMLNQQNVNFLRKEIKGVKLIAKHIDQTFTPTDIAPVTARAHTFHWKERDVDHGVVSVEEYFKQRYNKVLSYPNWPLVQRGKGQNIRFMPMEVCELAPGQRVKNKDISDDQHKVMVRQTAVTPFQRRQNILNMLKEAKFASDERLRQFYISMSMAMTQVSGRVLPAPMLQYTGSQVQPQSGQWNGGQLYQGATLTNWGFINFSRQSDDDIRNFAKLLFEEGHRMGMNIQPAYVDEIWNVRARPGEELEKTRNTLQAVKRAFDEAQCPLQLIVIILEKKQKDSPYNEIKRYSESVLGIMTQCLQADRVFQVSSRARDGGRKGIQALSNIILKINAKMGGVNVQIAKTDPIALKYLFQPILFLGADVTHPEPGDKRSPSIAAVCGNVDNHPNRYVGIELVQARGKEIIGGLKGAVKELLKSYYINTGGLKPDKIVFYRDGVSEGQFLQVLTAEVRAIQAACMELEATYKPGITFIVVQKRHHTRFFKKQINPNDKATVQNIPPGTVVDTVVIHPVEFDFFLCSHQGIQGTSKPTHYHVLFDQTGFTSDELQALTYQLCHTYARCTRSVSLPAPCYYAHLIAFRAKLRSKGHMINGSSSSSSSGSDGDKMTDEELKTLQQLISLAEPIKNSMYWQ